MLPHTTSVNRGEYYLRLRFVIKIKWFALQEQLKTVPGSKTVTLWMLNYGCVPGTMVGDIVVNQQTGFLPLQAYVQAGETNMNALLHPGFCSWNKFNQWITLMWCGKVLSGREEARVLCLWQFSCWGRSTEMEAFCAAFQHPGYQAAVSCCRVSRSTAPPVQLPVPWFRSQQCSLQGGSCSGGAVQSCPGRHSCRASSGTRSPTPPQHLTSTSFPLLRCFLLLTVGCYRETRVRGPRVDQECGQRCRNLLNCALTWGQKPFTWQSNRMLEAKPNWNSHFTQRALSQTDGYAREW